MNEKVKIKIIRNKEKIDIELPLKKLARFVPLESDVRPTYFIYCGFTFMPLITNYLMTWGNNWEKEAPDYLTTLALYGLSTKDRIHPIIMHQVLPHNANAGYSHEWWYSVLEKVNGP